jgi:predicted ester cyclase
MASTRELFDKITAAFNAHDRGKMADLTADTCVASGPGGMRVKGKQECLDFNMVWIDAFPDALVEVEKVHIDGDVAVDEGVFTGTHTGVFRTPMGDVPPTQKKVRGEYIGVTEFRDGKVVRQSLMFDRLQLMEQLGLAPAPAAAGRA